MGSDNCSKISFEVLQGSQFLQKYCFQKDFIKINSKTQGEEYSKAIIPDIFRKMSTHLNETVNSFQITYYILPLCLCFRKTCTDTAESKTKGWSILNKHNIVLMTTMGKGATKNVLLWLVKRWVLSLSSGIWQPCR